MFDTIFGLPVHVLVIHGVLVLIPAAAVAAVAIAWYGGWREWVRYLVLAIVTAALISVPVATESGAALMRRVNAGGLVAEQIRDHEAAGNLLLWPVVALWVMTIVVVVLHSRPHSRSATRLVGMLTLLAALAAIGQVVITGHLGATAVWSCTIDAKVCA